MTPELLTQLTDAQREAWELCQQATPGRWYAVLSADGRADMDVIAPGVAIIATVTSGDADWHFLAHARTALPDALRSLAELRAAVAEAPHDAGCEAKIMCRRCNCWKSRLK